MLFKINPSFTKKDLKHALSVKYNVSRKVIKGKDGFATAIDILKSKFQN